MTSIFTTAITNLVRYVSWSDYLIGSAFYTAMVFGSRGRAPRPYSRTLSSVLAIHAIFLIVLAAVITGAGIAYPFLPHFSTLDMKTGQMHGSIAGVATIVVLLAAFFSAVALEKKLIFVTAKR